MEIASDKLTEGSWSHFMEAIEPVESDAAEEIEDSGDESEEIDDEDEEYSDESEEMDYDMKERRYAEEVNAYYRSLWITPQWDVDSFDGLEYDDEKEAKRTGYMDEKDVPNWLSFRRQQIENKGFYVDRDLWPMYNYSNYSVIKDLEESAGLGKTCREYLGEMACLCLQKYNYGKKSEDEKFINVEFVKVVGGVYKGSGCPKYFITFMAKEKPGGPDVEYQAKAWSSRVKNSDPENHPILCRRAPPPKPSN